LPNGEKIVFLTVGGRTSAVVPSVQKKTGPLAKEMSEAESAGEEDAPKEKAKQKRSEVGNDGAGGGAGGTDVVVKASTKKPTPKSRQSKFKKGMNGEEETVDASATTKGRKRKANINGEAQSIMPARKRAIPGPPPTGESLLMARISRIV
jgi:formamidopyrimidine-DNA glycosylase